MWEALPKYMIERVVMICWAIWENRNSMVWKNQCLDPSTMVQSVLSYVHNWRVLRNNDHNGGTSTLPAVALTRWIPPPKNFLKMNIDIAMHVDDRRMGFGWCFRDEGGLVVRTIMFTMPGLYSVREAEVIGAREALSWIKQNG